MKLQIHLYRAFLLILTSVIVGVSCSDDPTLTEQDPQQESQQLISFASVTAEQETTTRATSKLAQDFVVYGYKNAGDRVFDGYTVHYKTSSAGTSTDNTSDYSYIDPSNNQFVKYWDFSAAQYRYWGFVDRRPSSSAQTIQPSADGQTLTITGLSLSTELPNPDYLISSLKVVEKAEYGQIVQLVFKRPYAQVQLRFFSGEPLADDQSIALTDVSFRPATGNIPSSGYTVNVSYPLTPSSQKETHEVRPSATSSVVASLQYNPVTIDKNYCTSAASVFAHPKGHSTATSYYVLPVSSSAEASSFILSAINDGEEMTAVIPAAYMHWAPNHLYTYVFKVSASTKGLDLFDVTIDPWVYGGRQDETFTHW